MESRFWRAIQKVEANEALDARLQMHWALQMVASVGHTFLDPRPDDSTPNSAWATDHRGLYGHWVTTDAGRRCAAVAFDDLTLMILSRQGVEKSLPLQGRTLQDGFAWLEEHFGRSIKRTEYELPSHRVGEGEAFSINNPQVFHALADWFDNSDLILNDLRKLYPETEEVRCWPHHFDIATLIKIPSSKAQYPMIGVGMTPGDNVFPQPYFYVSPWSHPEEAQPSFSPPGVWRTQDFFGGALTEDEILQAEEGQRRRIDDFLGRAIDVAKELLEAA